MPVAVVLACVGCGPSDDRVKIPTVPVSGKLSVDGKPFGPAKILLTPVPAEGRPMVSADVAEDGSYALSTYSRADEDPDGAPPGEYTVAFTFDVMNVARKMPAIKSGSDRVTVPEGEDEVALDINLESTGKEVDPGKAMMKRPSSGMSPGDLMRTGR